jgi:Fe-S cluster assembly scaffold protein SufB
MTDAQERSLERIGYDTSGKMNRSASFLIEDESAKEATSKEQGLVMASMREARQKYPWVKELEFSLVERDKDEFTRLVASHEDAAGNFIHVARGAKIAFPAQSCFLLKRQRHEQILHNIIVLEPDSQLHLITGCTTASYRTVGRHVAITEIFVRENAQLGDHNRHWGKLYLELHRTYKGKAYRDGPGRHRQCQRDRAVQLDHLREERVPPGHRRQAPPARRRSTR